MKSFITRDCIFNLQVIIISNRPAFREEYGRIREASAKLHGVNTSATLNLHPAVLDCLLTHQPDSWHSVILEQPHLSVDGVRVAYTRSEEHMETARQTVTTVGKYIKRHWPHLRDDVIRDLVALHCVQPGTIKVLSESTDQFIEYLKRSPDSCMNKEHFKTHPYHCYTPDLGWRFVVRVDADGIVQGRCLVNDTTFVRSYSRDRSWGADVEIEAWLQAHGFEREGCWEGKRLALIREGKQIVAPYLDGNCRNAEINEFAHCLEIKEDGELECDNVGGYASLPHEIHCESCEAGVDEDETCTTHDGSLICSDCASNRYVFSRYSENYIHESDSVYIESRNDHIHQDDLSDAGYIYVECIDEYLHEDDVITCESDNQFYPAEDYTDHAIYLVDSGSHEGEYWALDDVIVTRDGEIYHTDDSGDLIVCITFGKDKGEFVDIDETTEIENHILLTAQG